MGRQSHGIVAFNGGALSPSMAARVDWQKWGVSCKTLENAICKPQGGAMRRMGWKYAAEVNDSADKAWLVRFVASDTSAYQVEFSDGYIRFFANSGLLTEAAKTITGITKASPGVVTSASHGFSNGDQVQITGVVGMGQANNRTYTVANVTANTFELSGVNTSAYDTYTSGGSVAKVVRLVAPWTAAEITNTDGTFGLGYVQRNDVMYITHTNHQPQKLTRVSDTSWTLAALTPQGGPFQKVDPDETVTVYSSATSGSVTVTASASIFTADDVGSLFLVEERTLNDMKAWEAGKSISSGNMRKAGANVYAAQATKTTGTNIPTHLQGTRNDGNDGVPWLYLHSGFGYLTITGYTSATVVTGTVASTTIPSEAVGSGNATTRWAKAAWSDSEGWPSHVAIWNERLVFARGMQIWASVSGDYENFSDREGAEYTPDMAISLDISGDTADSIQWMSAIDDLIVGTSAGEIVVGKITSSEVLSSSNVRPMPVPTSYGGRMIKPVRANGGLIYVQRSGRRMREIKYQIESDGLRSTDLTIANDRILRGRAVQIAYQQEPDSIIWAVLEDGTLKGLTYTAEQDVLGWHDHPLPTGVTIESVSSIPHPDGGQDQVWGVLKKTINGTARRYVCYMASEWISSDGIENYFGLDMGATYDGASTSTITGLFFLEGETLQVLADGATHPNVTVANGKVSLNRSAEVVHLGLVYTTRVQPMQIEAGAADGYAQGKIKKIGELVVRLLDTVGFRYGYTTAVMDRADFRTSAMAMDQAVQPFTGDKRVRMPGGYNRDCAPIIEQDQPLPLHLLGLFPLVETQDDR